MSLELPEDKFTKNQILCDPLKITINSWLRLFTSAVAWKTHEIYIKTSFEKTKAIQIVMEILVFFIPYICKVGFICSVNVEAIFSSV